MAVTHISKTVEIELSEVEVQKALIDLASLHLRKVHSTRKEAPSSSHAEINVTDHGESTEGATVTFSFRSKITEDDNDQEK